MANPANLEGERFGRLMVVKRVGAYRGRALWECKCECGGSKYVITSALRNGNVRSCGCLHREQLQQRNRQAGYVGKDTRLHGVWHGMKQRCFDPRRKEYPNYGGRGITVCAEWRNSFEAFRKLRSAVIPTKRSAWRDLRTKLTFAEKSVPRSLDSASLHSG